MGAAEDLNLTGKDWLTVEESAFYCGVSRSQFDSHIAEYGIEPRNFMGRKLYEKAALYTAIYGARQWSRSQFSGGMGLPTSTGAMGRNAIGTPSVVEALAKLRKSETRRKRS